MDIAEQLDLFADFNGVPDEVARTEFYQHDANWTNRMILGDSLHVMASLAEREGLRGQVQMIYFDPPYGIKFNSNFQWSTTSRDVRDGNAADITREPEQVKAFRDTWRDGIHSYLTYLRDRLTVARELLSESGSIFVQIGDENVHRVRALMDEVFGEGNSISQITIVTTAGFATNFLSNVSDFILWYGKSKEQTRTMCRFKEKIRPGGRERSVVASSRLQLSRGYGRRETWGGCHSARCMAVFADSLLSQGRAKQRQQSTYQGKTYDSWEQNSHWKANYPDGMERLAERVASTLRKLLRYIRFHTISSVSAYHNVWTDTGTGGTRCENITSSRQVGCRTLYSDGDQSW